MITTLMMLFVAFVVLALVDLFFSRKYSGVPNAERLSCRWGYHKTKFVDVAPFGRNDCENCEYKREINPYLEV